MRKHRKRIALLLLLLVWGIMLAQVSNAQTLPTSVPPPAGSYKDHVVQLPVEQRGYWSNADDKSKGRRVFNFVVPKIFMPGYGQVGDGLNPPTSYKARLKFVRSATATGPAGFEDAISITWPGQKNAVHPFTSIAATVANEWKMHDISLNLADFNARFRLPNGSVIGSGIFAVEIQTNYLAQGVNQPSVKSAYDWMDLVIDTGRVVVMIPGLASEASVLDPLAVQLRAAGYSVTQPFSLVSVDRDFVQSNVSRLLDVDQIETLTMDRFGVPLDECILVTHSAGSPVGVLLQVRLSQRNPGKGFMAHLSVGGAFGGSLWAPIAQEFTKALQEQLGNWSRFFIRSPYTYADFDPRVMTVFMKSLQPLLPKTVTHLYGVSEPVRYAAFAFDANLDDSEFAGAGTIDDNECRGFLLTEANEQATLACQVAYCLNGGCNKLLGDPYPVLKVAANGLFDIFGNVDGQGPPNIENDFVLTAQSQKFEPYLWVVVRAGRALKGHHTSQIANVGATLVQTMTTLGLK